MEYMELLSRLGVASAHPGGFKASMKLFEQFIEPSDLRILEVGCGTGKSACYLAKKGLDITALDQHPIMLGKATIFKGILSGSEAEWPVARQGDGPLCKDAQVDL